MKLPSYNAVISLLPQPAYKITTDFAAGANRDIINTLFKCFPEAVQQTKRAARLFDTGNKFETLKTVWKWFRKNIVYQRDPKGRQWVQLPAISLRRITMDCKSYSLAIASILYNLGFDIRFIFANYQHSINKLLPSHVYTGVFLNGKTLPVDGVYNKFLKEKKPLNKWVYKIKSV